MVVSALVAQLGQGVPSALSLFLLSQKSENTKKKIASGGGVSMSDTRVALRWRPASVVVSV